MDIDGRPGPPIIDSLAGDRENGETEASNAQGVQSFHTAPAAPYLAGMANEFEQAAAGFGTRGAILGLDLGEKTIGVASCDADRRVATPVRTLRRTKFTAEAEALKTLAKERSAVGFVLGLPRNMDGTEGARAQSTRAFARNLANMLALPVALWDERWSTVAMERSLIALDTSRSKRAAKIDESAATFILQGAIDRLRSLAGSGAGGR